MSAVITRTRVIAIAAFVFAGAGGVVLARVLVGGGSEPDEGAYSSLLAATPWVSAEAVENAARLERLGNAPQWNERDAAFVLEALRLELPHLDPTDRSAPISQSSSAQQYYLAQQLRGLARGVLADHLRLDRGIPVSLREPLEAELLALLEQPDDAERLAGVTHVVTSRLVQEPKIRTRIEAIRLGDPSPAIRANAERQLAHYDYLYEGAAPAESPEGCNTCP